MCGNLISWVFQSNREMVPIVTIDGPSGSGKGTIAKALALRGVPTTVLFNKEGKEFARIIGSIDFGDKEFINWIKLYN